MVLLQQQAQAQAVGKKARELYVGNLTVGAVTDATLMELFNGSLGSILAAQGDTLVRCRSHLSHRHCAGRALLFATVAPAPVRCIRSIAMAHRPTDLRCSHRSLPSP